MNNQNETTTSWGLRYERLFSRLVVNESGSIQRFMGKEGDQQWAFLGSVPLDQCDIYGKCGAFGKCENITDLYLNAPAYLGSNPGHQVNGLLEMHPVGV